MNRRRASLFGGVALAAAAGGVGLWQWRSARQDDADPGLWGLELERPEGGRLALAPLRGSPLVINFWATWCPPCVAEMPSLERLHRALSRDGLVVLGVSADEDEAALDQFVKKAGLTFPILRDPGGVVASGSYRTTGYPETFVVDARGVIKETYVGPAEWDTPEALDHFRLLLKPADR